MSDDVPRGNPGVDPDDLDISKSEYVRELGGDRYVVSAGSRPPRTPSEGETPEEIPDIPEDARDAPQSGDTSDTVPSNQLPDADSSPARDAVPSRDDADTVTSASGSGSTAESSAKPSDVTSSSSASDAVGSVSASDQSAPAGSDDGLPTDPARGSDPPTEHRPVSDDRPASHERRGAPRGTVGTGSSAGGAAGGDVAPPDLDASAVGQWLAASLADTEFAYGFDATLSLKGRTVRHRMASDDVGETFETFVTWFADTAAGDTPTEDAIGILLAGMDAGPRLPPNAVRSALADLGVSRDDSVEDLLAALDRAGGLRL